MAKRVFISYAASDREFAGSFVQLLRLGCNLTEEQVFFTDRPGEIPSGEHFTDTIRAALERASASIFLLTPAFYESRFCLAELGAVWGSGGRHMPILVPPVNFADLDGVQLGEQALRADRPLDLDHLRDEMSDALGTSARTPSWTQQRDEFLRLWETVLRHQISRPTFVERRVVEAAEAKIEDLGGKLEATNREIELLRRNLDRLRKDRGSSVSTPRMPEPVDDVERESELLEVIERAARACDQLPAIAREALFAQAVHGYPLTVGGSADNFDGVAAKKAIEDGYVAQDEEAGDAVWPRSAQPQVGDAIEALQAVREWLFDASTLDSAAEAEGTTKQFLADRFDINDPKFELRPTWEKLGLL